MAKGLLLFSYEWHLFSDHWYIPIILTPSQNAYRIAAVNIMGADTSGKESQSSTLMCGPLLALIVLSSVVILGNSPIEIVSKTQNRYRLLCVFHLQINGNRPNIFPFDS